VVGPSDCSGASSACVPAVTVGQVWPVEYVGQACYSRASGGTAFERSAVHEDEGGVRINGKNTQS
jgi:hypothetical protein